MILMMDMQNFSRETYATIDSEKEGRVYLIDGDDIINAGTGSVDALVISHLKVF